MSEGISSPLKRLLGGSALILLGNIIGLGATFVTRLVAARHLGPSDYGLLILGVTLLNILILVSLLGLHQGLARELPRESVPTAAFYGAIIIAVPLSVAVAVLALSVTAEVGNILADPSFYPIYRLFVLALPFVVFTRLVVGTARGCENTTGRVLVWNICKQGLVAGVVVLSAFLGWSVNQVAQAWIGTLVFTAIIAGLFVIAYTDVDPLRMELLTPAKGTVLPRASSLVVFSLPLMLSGTMRLTMQQADNFLIGAFLLSSDVGVYDSTYTLGRLLFIVTATVEYLFLPIFSDLHAEGERDRMDRFYKMTAKWMAFLVVPAYLLLVLHPEFVLSTVFGADYEVGATSLQLVATGFLFHVIFGITGNGLIAIGNTRSMAVGNGLALLLNLGTNVLLIPRYGITGAAMASAFSYALVNTY